jgi:hypothetical protein
MKVFRCNPPICLQIAAAARKPYASAKTCYFTIKIIIQRASNVNDFCSAALTIFHFRQNFSLIKVFSRKYAQKQGRRQRRRTAFVRIVQLGVTTCTKIYDLY